jgi:hypothetical protein
LGRGDGCSFTFFTFVHILLMALFCVIFFYFDETDSKQPKIHMEIHTSLWILKISRKKSKEPKVSRLLPNVRDFQEEIDTLGYVFKNLKKIYSLAYGIFLFFMISPSQEKIGKRIEVMLK